MDIIAFIPIVAVVILAVLFLTNRQKKTPAPSCSRSDPKFYQGTGAWIAPSHIPPEEFAKQVQELDPYINTLPTELVTSLTSHIYLLNTIAPRYSTQALYVTDPETPGCYPATIFQGRYDYLLAPDTPFPASGPILPYPTPTTPNPTLPSPILPHSDD